MSWTHQFTRDALLTCVNREVAMRKSVFPGRVAARKMAEESARCEIAMMESVAALLETYPLRDIAETAVGVVVADLKARRGFDELILECRDWPQIQAAMVAKLANHVCYTDPLPVPAEEALELDFTPAPEPEAVAVLEFE